LSRAVATKERGVTGAPRRGVTGDRLPSGLQDRIESLSGVTMEGVWLYRDSPLPAKIGALAFAEGSTIHLGPGQEAHLAHEAWHVAQQRRGMVAPTRYVRGRAINDDPVLEREAETMGARAQAGIPRARPDGLRRALHTAPVLQGVFPDAYNAQRRKEQSISASAVQMDHIVADVTLGVFAQTLATLGGVADAPSRWEVTREARDGLRERLAKLHRMKEFGLGSEGQLVNLPANVVPGRQGQIQGADDRFDPQVAFAERGARGQNLHETALSRSLRPMDVAIRQLNQIVDKDALPATPSARKDAKRYDRTTDELFASLLQPITAGLDAMVGATEPVYDPKVWYAYDGGWVKKRSAEWLASTANMGYGLTPLPAHAPWNHQFAFTVRTLVMQGTHPAVVDVDVDVDINVPTVTWTHVYARHYLPTFQHVVEDVNTFWKIDPHAYLTGGAGLQLLERELELLLRRSFPLSKSPDNVVAHDTESTSWSESADALFFQGNADLTAGDPALGGTLYNINVLLKSIAPQNADLGYALLPEHL
jgi:hypothetical protein